MARKKTKNNRIKTKKKGGTRRRVKSASLKRSKKSKSKRNKSEGSKPKYRLGPYAPLPRRGETRAQFNRRRRRHRTNRNLGRQLASQLPRRGETRAQFNRRIRRRRTNRNLGRMLADRTAVSPPSSPPGP